MATNRKSNQINHKLVLIGLRWYTRDQDKKWSLMYDVHYVSNYQIPIIRDRSSGLEPSNL